MIINPKKVKFKAVRASGPGGQKVNRRSTKVQLWIKIGDLELSEGEKKRLRQKLEHQISHLDELWVENEEERSQELNRERALSRLNDLIKEALKVPPPRIPTRPPRRAKESRLRVKKIKSEKKKLRRKFYRN